MIPNPILKVLSTLSTHDVRYLLMGGQACVLYGAAEFSRDCDIAILCEPENLSRLRTALADLDAVSIAVPPFDVEYLLRGHVVHFRCHSSGVEGMRLDVMAKMRGVATFEELWERRVTLEDQIGSRIELLALPDLIAAKKTQRDKDWPMIRRLVEAHFTEHSQSATENNVRFWFKESRTPEMLIELAKANHAVVELLLADRPLLSHARSADLTALSRALLEEQEVERDADREYWGPLSRELEQLRQDRQRGN